MENLETIVKKVHGVDHDLLWLADSIQDENLRARVRAVQATWRNLFGMDAGHTPEPAKKRGRKRKADREDLIPLGPHETPAKPGMATTSRTPVAS